MSADGAGIEWIVGLGEHSVFSFQYSAFSLQRSVVGFSDRRARWSEIMGSYL